MYVGKYTYIATSAASRIMILYDIPDGAVEVDSYSTGHAILYKGSDTVLSYLRYCR